MKQRFALLVSVLIFSSGASATLSQIPAEIGGEGSVVSTDSNAFSLPLKHASTAHRRSFMVGNSLFKENWVSSPATVKTRQGLGPTFNAQSCSSCHFKDGRGAPPQGPDEQFVGLLIRLSVPGKDSKGGVVPAPHYGDQLQHRANVGIQAEGDVRVHYTEINGSFADGSSYTLLKPTYKFHNLAWGPLPPNVRISPRIAPQMIGLGLLEAIDEAALLNQCDEEDQNKDGISGRANYVWDFTLQKKRIGRFGWKANQPSLRQQNAGAFLGDMGVTSPVFSAQNCASKDKACLEAPSLKETEISERDLNHVTVYTQILAVPQRRNIDKPLVQKGYKMFRQANCQQCHVESYTTGEFKDFPELSNQKIYPFTDLLLHDMGEDLADGRDDYEASGSEWRTPPLWGIGLIKTVNRHTRFLHDGRARNLEEAILWHGGEAQKSRQSYITMSQEERLALIKFLESL